MCKWNIKARAGPTRSPCCQVEVLRATHVTYDGRGLGIKGAISSPQVGLSPWLWSWIGRLDIGVLVTQETEPIGCVFIERGCGDCRVWNPQGKPAGWKFQQESMLQSEGNLRQNSFLLMGPQVFSTDWMRPTHIMEGDVIQSQLFYMLITSKNAFKATSRLTFDQTAGHHSLVKVTQKINHRSWYLVSSFQTDL